MKSSPHNQLDEYLLDAVQILTARWRNVAISAVGGHSHQLIKSAFDISRAVLPTQNQTKVISGVGNVWLQV